MKQYVVVKEDKQYSVYKVEMKQSTVPAFKGARYINEFNLDIEKISKMTRFDTNIENYLQSLPPKLDKDNA